MKIPVSKAYAKWMDEDAERLNAMAELARKVAVTLPTREEAEKRAFCPTGPGGGIDNSCSAVSASDPSLKERVPFTPIGDGKNSDFIRVPSVDELTEALTGSNSSKGTKIGSAKDLPAGTPVALRIDIPAFNYSTKNMGKAIYAVTIHENKGGKSFGSPLAYEPMARLTGPVTFAAKEKEATKVATGEANKFPLATVKGNFDPSRVMPPDIDSWTPVGYDPKKAAYFYDKKTGREVMGGTDAVSVGNSVFVRIPKYGYRNAKETYRDAGFWGIEYRAADCGRQDGGKFGPGNKCAGDGDADRPAPSKPDVLPKAFPPGSQKFRDAVDSASPDPAAIWDRSKGRAETPPARVLSQAADEQETSGETLTPEAEASYADLVNEIGRQYEALVESGLKVRAWRGEGEPYGDPPGSTRPNSDKMRAEVARTGEFSFFMTENGFGTGAATPDHPMLRETRYKTADGEPMIANDLFRVVHDMVAHVRGGYSFSTNGEYNGMLTHASTLPESAWPALFAETFGQNAVYEKTGNYAAQNAYASKVGPEIIKAELTKRGKKSRRAADPAQDSDEPLGYQHLKVRPWLMKGGAESRSADCGRDENGRFGQDNDCQKDGQGGGDAATAEKPQSKLFSTDENATWFPASGREPFPGASRYNEVSVSGGKSVAKSFDSLGIKPEDAVSLLGAPEQSVIFMRPAPDFGQKFYAFSGTATTPVLVGFEANVAGIRRGLEGTYVLGSRRNNETGKQDLVLYGNVMDVLPSVSATADRRHAAARMFYKTMVNGIENARKAGVSTVMFSAAGNSTDAGRPGMFKGYTIWPRMGFDGPLPKHIVEKLPPDLSHARTLMDLHATREGTRWWAKNGEDIDVELNLADRNSPQNKVFDRFVKHFSRDRRDLPLGEGDGWLSPEDLARLDEMWAEIWDEDDILDDYDGGEQKFVVEARAYCPTGEGNGVDNSCSSRGPGTGLTNLGGKVEAWGTSNDTEIWTPDRPMFRGADKIGEIMINRPADARAVAGDALKLTIPEIVTASGALIDSIDRAGTSKVRMTITPALHGEGLSVSWKVVGRATGKGYKGDDKAFAPIPGTIVNAVEAARVIETGRDGRVRLMQDAYFIHPDYQGKGLALESVIRQTSVSGIHDIIMGAARWDHQNPNQRMNGYWRWPMYGYNASIPTIIRDSKSGKIPSEFSKARSLLDIYATPGGIDWWKGEGEDVVLHFDTRPRSQSRLVLLQLQDAVRKKHGSRSIDMTGDDKSEMSTDCDNDPDVEAAWEEIIKKGLKQDAPGRIEELEASAEKFLQERAKDGRPPEVFPH